MARTLQRHDAGEMALHDPQWTVARRYGFSGWPALVHYVKAAADLTVDPARVDDSGFSVPDRFCALAVLRYTDDDAPPRWESAAQILTAEPGLVDAHVWAAAAAADPDALARHLTRGNVVNAAGGPFGWTPRLYLCYSRVEAGRNQDQIMPPQHFCSIVALDPNAGYLWRGMSRRSPRSPECSAKASRGRAVSRATSAHPGSRRSCCNGVRILSLYNRMFRADDSHLEMLFAHGLAHAGPSPWERSLGEAMETREQMWQRQIDWAAEFGFTQRLHVLARHGVDIWGVRPNVAESPADPNTLDDHGATPLHHAAWDGDPKRIRRLLDAGADPSITDRRFGDPPRRAGPSTPIRPRLPNCCVCACVSTRPPLIRSSVAVRSPGGSCVNI